MEYRIILSPQLPDAMIYLISHKMKNKGCLIITITKENLIDIESSNSSPPTSNGDILDILGAPRNV